MNTTEILQKTEKLVNGDRDKTHGNKIINHENIARLWSAYLQNKTKLNIIISPEDLLKKIMDHIPLNNLKQFSPYSINDTKTTSVSPLV